MKRWLRIIFRVIRHGIPFIFYVLFAYPRRNKISRIKRFLKLKYYVSNLLDKVDMKLYVTGLENIPNEQSFMITPNHQSLPDGAVFFKIFNDPVAFVSKAEAKKMFVAREILGTMGSIFMDRDNLKEELRVMKKVKKSMLEDNVKWIIYPEGTRSRNENYRLNEFKAGTFKFPMQINKKIIPCCVHGTFRLLKGKYNLKEYPVHVHFFKPFTKEDYKIYNTQQIAKMTQDMIQEKLDEFIKIDNEMIKNLEK